MTWKGEGFGGGDGPARGVETGPLVRQENAYLAMHHDWSIIECVTGKEVSGSPVTVSRHEHRNGI